MIAGLLAALAAAIAFALTWAMRRYALTFRVLDVPNDRSAHTTPTPRGGGLAIAAAFLMAIGILAATGWIDARLAIALAGSGTLVALIGFLDDHSSVAVHWRLLAHVAAAGWGLYWLGGFPPLEVAGRVVDLGWAGEIAAAIGLAWLLNLYNFMDGIDGLAATEAVIVSLGAAALCAALGAGIDPVPAVLLAAAAFGFLLWNWPPARIFMGDSGSGFLGLTVGLLAVRAASAQPRFLWVWLILLGVFVVDATLTLLRRLLREEMVFEAHRDHAYQRMAQRAGHRAVTLTVGAVNVFWLLPVAAAVAGGWIDGALGLAVAYAPLIWIAHRAGSTMWAVPRPS